MLKHNFRRYSTRDLYIGETSEPVDRGTGICVTFNHTAGKRDGSLIVSMENWKQLARCANALRELQYCQTRATFMGKLTELGYIDTEHDHARTIGWEIERHYGDIGLLKAELAELEEEKC